MEVLTLLLVPLPQQVVEEENAEKMKRRAIRGIVSGCRTNSRAVLASIHAVLRTTLAPVYTGEVARAIVVNSRAWDNPGRGESAAASTLQGLSQ